MAWPPFWIGAIVVVLCLPPAVLAIRILMLRGQRAAARCIAAFLWLNSLAFLYWGLGLALNAPTENWLEWFGAYHLGASIVFLLLTAAATALILVALTFPTTLWPRDRWSVALFLAALPTLGVGAVVWQELNGWRVRSEDRSVAGDTTTTLNVEYELAPLLALAFFVCAVIATVVILWIRRRRAQTGMERRRLTHMFLFVALPFGVALVSFGAAIIMGVNAFIEAFPTIEKQSEADRLQAEIAQLLLIGFILLATLPSYGLAFGLLRYRLLETDLRVRVTIRRGVLASVFVASFLAATEFAQAIIQDRFQSAALGALVLIPLFVAFGPLQRFSDRLAGRVLPGTDDAEKYREFRRWDIYRATFEDLSRDGRISDGERRTLDALARNLGLNETTIITIETQVRRERAT